MTKELINNPEDGNIIKIMIENRMKEEKRKLYPSAEQIIKELI